MAVVMLGLWVGLGFLGFIELVQQGQEVNGVFGHFDSLDC